MTLDEPDRATGSAELRDGDCVNLGIGLPALVAAHLPPSIHVFFHSENGIIGHESAADVDLAMRPQRPQRLGRRPRERRTRRDRFPGDGVQLEVWGVVTTVIKSLLD